MSISLFALKESLSRRGLSCSRRPLSPSLSLLAVVNWVGRGGGGGERKVLKLLCQIERERERLTEPKRAERAPAFAPPPPRPLFLIENETNPKTHLTRSGPKIPAVDYS